jgi:AraC-like DNA-binding protein
VSKLFELCFYLYQDVYRKFPNKPQNPHKNIMQIKSALNYIHVHYKEAIRLKDISNSCNLSNSSCCRLFKKIVHHTPLDYLLSYRIQKSIPYLLNEGLNITEVAISVGFSSSSYYSEIFKKYMNCSPTVYKHKIKNYKGNIN